jgi:GT2 family glycosyltransferase
MKIAVCIPLRGSVSDLFLLNFVSQLLKNSREHDMAVISSTRMPLDAARNEILQIAMKNGSDYLWWLDSDIILPKNVNVLQSLIEMDKGIASALYFKKEQPYDPVLIILKDGKPFFIRPVPSNQVLKVDAVGLGCCLVKADVLRKMVGAGEPVFEFRQKMLPDSVETVGEDVNFCLRAKEFGFETYINTGLVCGHLGNIVVDEKTYDRFVR